MFKLLRRFKPHRPTFCLLVAQANPDPVCWALNGFGYNSKKQETLSLIPEENALLTEIFQDWETGKNLPQNAVL